MRHAQATEQTESGAATREKIAAGLERAFAELGFAETDIETLRAAAGVSLRTLYKYFPTRGARVMAALEHRHRRFLGRVAADLPADPAAAAAAYLERVGAWMAEEAAHGCLFHAAAASAPADPELREMLARHKREATEALAGALGRAEAAQDLALISEGLMQSWPLHGRDAVRRAQRLAATLLQDG